MAEALIIKTTLSHYKPLTWRRIAVPLNTTYEQLHAILQIAYGWQNLQPFAFVPEIASDFAYVHFDYAGEDPEDDAHDDADLYLLRDDLADGAVDYVYGQWQVRINQVQTAEQPVAPQCLAGAGAGFGELDQAAKQPYSRQGINDVLAIWAADQEFTDPDSDDGLDQMTKGLVAALTTDQQVLIDAFLQSNERQALTQVNDVNVQIDLVGLLIAKHQPIERWTVKDWQQAIDEQIDPQVDADTAPMTLAMDAQVARMLARTNHLQAPLAEVMKLLSDRLDEFAPADPEIPAVYYAFYTSKQGEQLTQKLGLEATVGALRAFYDAWVAGDHGPFDNWEAQALRQSIAATQPADYEVDEAAFAEALTAFAEFLQTDVLTGQAARTIVDTVKSALAARGQLPHVEAVGKRQWSKQTAGKVHEQAKRDLDRVWDVAGFAGAHDAVIQLALSVIDDIYATALLTPLHWSDEALSAALKQQLANAAVSDQAAVEGLLSVYLSDRAKHTSLALERARALQALMHAQVSKLSLQG